MGCAGDRYNQSSGLRPDDNRAVEHHSSQRADQSVEDRRTAERVREALAAAPEYKFDGVQVTAGNGVVQLSGFVNTRTQRSSAEAVTSKVEGVRSVENNLTVRD